MQELSIDDIIEQDMDGSIETSDLAQEQNIYLAEESVMTVITRNEKQ